MFHHLVRLPADGAAGRPSHCSWALSLLGYTGVCLMVAVLAGASPAFAQTTSAVPAARQWVTPPPGDVVRGQALYQAQCTACHNVDSNKIGPAHRGVMGRRVGSLPGYKYSDELAASRLRWTPQTLNVWLADPEDLVPGQRMGFQVDDLQQRADLIAFLATLR
ncbi:c-type cytochrome [Polaromonas sp. YR568]|uniref:c-type cytochrome n=1 Tax=Polaromonas sp. YR568 TaxID=1855301 RepID=UPI003137EAA5